MNKNPPGDQNAIVVFNTTLVRKPHLDFQDKYWLDCPPIESPSSSPVRYAKFESIRYFIVIDILQNCLIDIDIFQNHHIDIDIDIDIFGIALSISISIFFRIALSISISISIFSTSPYRYRYRYRYFSKVSIYRQSIFHIDILTRRRSKKTFFTGVHGEGVIKCVLQGQKNAFFITFWINFMECHSIQFTTISINVERGIVKILFKYRYFQDLLIDIDISLILLIDIYSVYTTCNMART